MFVKKSRQLQRQFDLMVIRLPLMVVWNAMRSAAIPFTGLQLYAAFQLHAIIGNNPDLPETTRVRHPMATRLNSPQDFERTNSAWRNYLS